MSMDALLVAELRERAARLMLAALREEAYAYPLEGGSSRARRNRKKVQNVDLAVRYERLADQVEKEGA